MAATLTGLTTTTLATACPCLKVAPSEPAADGAEPRDDGDPMEEANPYEGGELPDEGEDGGESPPDELGDGSPQAEADAEPAEPAQDG